MRSALIAGGVGLVIGLASARWRRKRSRRSADVNNPGKQVACPSERERFKGQCVVVTGGANGIGAGICRAFVQEGATVWCADVDAVKAAELVAA